MAWNKPGNNNNNQDPWGGRQNNGGPPDLDKILSDFLKKIRALFKFDLEPAKAWRPSHIKECGVVAGIFALAVLMIWIVAGLYIVNPAEQAVVLRFGKYADTQESGLHWMARFIDSKYLVDVQKIYSFSVQSDFLTKASEQSDLPSQYIAVKPAPTSTDKSKNLVKVEMNVQYRINNAKDYLFNVVNPDETIKEVASGALSDVVGKMKLDDVLTTGRETLSAGVRERIKNVLAAYHPGLEVVAVTLRKAQAPDEVQAAFNDVNRADQDQQTYVQQAEAYASKVVPLAQGVAARILADATAYQQQSVLTAQAQIAKYEALLNVYKASPDLTRERIYLETMQNIFSSTNKVLLDTASTNNVIYLPLDKMMQAADDRADNSYPLSFQNPIPEVTNGTH